ncbi:MAG: four helix bundle protein [Terriglobia bacterium]
MARIEKFEDIEAWQEARNLTKKIYALTSEGIFSKDFALKDQVRRAAVSIMSNIAEGFERRGDKEFHHFLSMAKASGGELRSQLYVAFDQHYLDQEQFAILLDQVSYISRLIGGLMKYLEKGIAVTVRKASG